MLTAEVTASSSSLDRSEVELVPKFFDTDRIASPAENPIYSPAMVADLVEGFRQHGQLVPAWLCPCEDDPASGRYLCLEGNRRLAAARLLGRKLWAFELDRYVPEEERIVLLFQHNAARRIMSREEVAERASRWMELTGRPAADAAKMLAISPASLSRALGEKRIPPALRPRADRLGLSIRALVAAVPLELMVDAIAFAETPGPDGKKQTRDQVAVFIGQLKKGGGKARKPKTIPLRHNGRMVTLTVGDGDTATLLADELKALAGKLRGHAAVAVDALPVLFQ